MCTTTHYICIQNNVLLKIQSPLLQTIILYVSLSMQPKLMAKDLLDLVASHFNLKEKEYFGISYTDET